jgi:hypothetical protein
MNPAVALTLSHGARLRGLNLHRAGPSKKGALPCPDLKLPRRRAMKTDEERAAFDSRRTADGVEVARVLVELCALYPAERLGQSIENAIWAARKTIPEFSRADLFMLENDDLLSALVLYRDALRK